MSVITERNTVNSVSGKIAAGRNVVLHLSCFFCVNLIHIPTKWNQSKKFVSKLALLHIKSKLSTRRIRRHHNHADRRFNAPPRTAGRLLPESESTHRVRAELKLSRAELKLSPAELEPC